MTCAPLETLAANAGRWFARAQRLLRLIVESRLGSFGHRGNGHYREELRRGISAMRRYLTASQLEASRTRLAYLWAIWHRSRAHRCGWVRVCDPWQRIQRARSPAGSGASALSC